MIIKAPFTPEQVKSLNDYQKSGIFHSFTCECRADLIATENGWVCEHCNYTQDWSHDFMADNSWRKAEVFPQWIFTKE